MFEAIRGSTCQPVLLRKGKATPIGFSGRSMRVLRRVVPGRKGC